MAGKNGIRIKASKHPDKFSQLPVEGEFRKRDVDVLDEDPSLWGYFVAATAMKKAGYDDDANVTIWVWRQDVRDFLQDEFGE